MLVASDGSCLVVDPGVTRREVAGIAAAIAERGWRPVAVWSTHDHWDHRLDGPRFAGVPRWGAGSGVRSDELARARDEDDELARVLVGTEDAPATIGPAPHRFPQADAAPGGPAGPALDWAGPLVLVLEHAAHAPGHTALHLPEAGVLIAGDMLSDVEIPLLDDAATEPVADYRAGVALLASSGATLVVPGHGTPGALPARAAADHGYLDALVRAATPAGVRDRRAVTGWQASVHAQQHALVRR